MLNWLKKKDKKEYCSKCGIDIKRSLIICKACIPVFQGYHPKKQQRLINAFQINPLICPMPGCYKRIINRHNIQRVDWGICSTCGSVSLISKKVRDKLFLQPK